MYRNTARFFMVIILTGLFSIVSAQGGYLFVNETESQIGRQETTTAKAYIEKEKMRVESENGESTVLIFRDDKELFWMIDHGDKTYTEITKADLEKVQKKIADAMDRIEKQMKNVPAEQRQMMENMMKNRMPGMTEKVEYKKEAEGVKVNRWMTDKYAGYTEGEKVEEIWTAAMDELDIDRDELQVMKGWSEFFEQFSKDMPSFFRAFKVEAGEEEGFSGFPVRHIYYSDGEMQYRTELKEFSEKDFDDSLFELPVGYEKKASPMEKM